MLEDVKYGPEGYKVTFKFAIPREEGSHVQVAVEVRAIFIHPGIFFSFAKNVTFPF